MRFYYEAVGQDPFNALPMTFHVKSGLQDPEFLRFKSYYDADAGAKTNIWIIKPGENTNRG
jgi:tubulin--tyrosine ligase